MPHEHERRDDIGKDEVKGLMKEALKEWLDAKYAEFGRMSANAILAALVVALAYFILHQNGWHKPADVTGLIR